MITLALDTEGKATIYSCKTGAALQRFPVDVGELLKVVGKDGAHEFTLSESEASAAAKQAAKPAAKADTGSAS